MKRIALILCLLLIPFLCDAQQIIVTKKKAGGGGGASYTANFASDANPLGSPWVQGPTGYSCKSASGVATLITNGYSSDMYYNNTFADNQYSQAKILTWGGATYGSPGVSVRNNGTDMYYAYTNYNATRIYVQRWNGGTPAVIGACSAYYSQSTSAGNVLRIEASGTTITVKLEGSTIATCTDSTISSGRAGIYIYGDDDATIDDWAGGDL